MSSSGAVALKLVLTPPLVGAASLASFFLTLAVLLPDGIGIVFAAAIVIALAVQGASPLVGRRVGLA